MRMKLWAAVAVMAMSILMPGVAHADTPPGGGKKKTADCHAYVESTFTSGVDVVSTWTVSCNVLVPYISVYGWMDRGNTTVDRLKECSGVASCSLTLRIYNPAGSQKFTMGWDPGSTFVYWPNMLPEQWKLDSSSSATCPDMGCRMVQKTL